MEQVVKLLHVSICLSFSVTTSQTFINRLWKNFFTSTLERKKYFALFTFSKKISSFKDFFSSLSYFLYLILYALEHYCFSYYQTKHLPPSFISHSPECFCILFHLAHILNGIFPILFETKVKIRIKYSIQSSAMCWKTWKVKHYLALSKEVPVD